MPPLIEDDASDIDVEENGVAAHTESNLEADVDAKDQLKDELMSDIGERKGAKAAKAEKSRVSPTASNKGDDDDDEEEAYEVESIRNHEWRRKTKKSPYVLLYVVKWKGWPESDNTLEPEENLVGSRSILAAYHHKIGGAPQPPTEDEGSGTIKKKQSRKSLRQDSQALASEKASAPPAKRQRRAKEESAAQIDDDESFGTWTPGVGKWEDDIKEIQTVERDDATGNLYILMVFKNGRKSKVQNGLVRAKCPQKLLDFYEAHLNFVVHNRI